jgi:hypothetical protein
MSSEFLHQARALAFLNAIFSSRSPLRVVGSSQAACRAGDHVPEPRAGTAWIVARH